MGTNIKKNVPYKVVSFTWFVARNACLTQENLQRRGFHMRFKCCLCGYNPESVNHLFLHCRTLGTVQLLHFFLNILGLITDYTKAAMWVIEVLTHQRKEFQAKDMVQTIRACTWWTVEGEFSKSFEDKESPLRRSKCLLLFIYINHVESVTKHYRIIIRTERDAPLIISKYFCSTKKA